MSPGERYQKDIDSGAIQPDPAQQLVVAELDRLWRELHSAAAESSGLMSSLRRLLGRPARQPVTGLYLWGGVGRGKTYLMDLLFESVSLHAKTRTHFHRFMQRVHRELARRQGQKNPLSSIAGDIADESRLLCFDEFFVLDIGDAMILAGLLRPLFERGVVLVATSNIHPGGLYENGLQRARFLPAIDLIKRHTNVVEIGAGTDFRLRSLEQATLYLSPATAETRAQLLESFRELAPETMEHQENTQLEILGREIDMVRCAGDVGWFEFQALCEGPRSAFDYVEIAREFHTLILSNVPALSDVQREQVRRFINLIDELYDRRVKLIISAAVPLEALYTGQDLAFEFERTRSRLVEMQSQDYLGSAHRG